MQKRTGATKCILFRIKVKEKKSLNQNEFKIRHTSLSQTSQFKDIISLRIVRTLFIYYSGADHRPYMYLTGQLMQHPSIDCL